MRTGLKTGWVVVTGAVTAGAVAAFLGMTQEPASGQERFQVEEATISGLHAAIRAGQTTCFAIVQTYVDRAMAYNGVANQLVTESGALVPAEAGTVRAGTPLAFPTATVKASTLLPDLEQYRGTPIEFGRMQATASDPAVQQQYGMTVGIPNAGQVNGIGTINLRGERSVTCKGDFDKAPSAGALPAGAPAVCEAFRKQPDALERAAELDARYGRTPDLAALPMYCVPFSFKDPFDTKDMRSTGGADARYDIDFPARDHVLVEQLRSKGAIIYAKSVLTEYNGRAGNPGGRHSPDQVLPSTLGYQRSTWAGNPVNVYDSTRAASLGSSSGSAVSVSANLVMCGLCEETRASCRGPANHNSVALILPHKAMIGFNGGAIGSDIYNDRTGIHCRNITDAAKVLDALKDPATGYYDPRDVFTTVPRTTVLAQPYADAAGMPGTAGSLKGMRIGIVRESMLTAEGPGARLTQPIITAVAAEIKAVLGEHLGATLVESAHPLWRDDPQVEDMTTSYTTALTRLVPVFFPDILYRLTSAGEPLFPEFAAAIKPTEFAPGKTFGSGTLAPIDYMVGLAEGRIPPPSNLDIRTIQQQAGSHAFRFHFVQYATRRAAEWEKRGFKETLVDFPTLNARSTFWGDDQRAAFKNWEEVDDMRNPLDERQGIDERIMLRELLRRVDMMVILENNLDLVVRLHTPLPPGRIGMPQVQGTTGTESAFGPNAGETEVLVPAGYVQTVYDASFALSPDRTRYVAVNNETPTPVPAPGMPFSLVFRAEPGKEDVILKVASAYEAASKRRVSPPALGPVPSRVSRAAQ
jgi:Asp-tRNA(Asn)/Glu-tRNA(Gln) amidotransferase A subunit family amidase